MKFNQLLLRFSQQEVGHYVLLLLVLLGMYHLLYFQDKPFLLIPIFFICIIFLFFKLLKIVIKQSNVKEIGIIVFIELLIILFFFSRINNLELWGDEIGVIELAEYPFEQISYAVATYHASVPPFDYWIMHFWSKIVNAFDVNYQEFLYRVPYLFYHVLSSLFFYKILRYELKSSKLKNSPLWAKFILILGPIGYFIHPLLLAYAVEVRFYEMAVLGVAVTLYLFLTKKLTETSSIILSGIFCLNSIFQFIIIFPLLLVNLIDRKLRKTSIIAIIFHLFLMKIIWPRLNMYQPVATNESLNLIQTSFINFFAYLFSSWLQIALVVFIATVYVFHLKRKKFFFFFALFFFGIFSISFSSYIKGYFDFHLRHFIFTLPIVLFLIFTFPLRISKTLSQIVIVTFVLVFFIPWFRKDMALLEGRETFSKSLVGAKEIVSIAKQNNKSLLLFPIHELHDEYLEGVYDFNARSIIWYANRHKIEVMNEQLEQISCEELSEKKSIVVIRFWDRLPCLDTVTQPRYFGDSIIYEI